ncbi:hypothetical protein FKM82_023832 [Ascaphus truei]
MFHTWRYQEQMSPRPQLWDLIHLATKWLKPEAYSPTQSLEMVVLDHFIRALPQDLRHWVGQGDPLTYDAMVGAVEHFLATCELSRSTFSHTNQNPRPNTNSRSQHWNKDPRLAARFQGVERNLDKDRNAKSLKEFQERTETIVVLSLGRRDILRLTTLCCLNQWSRRMAL